MTEKPSGGKTYGSIGHVVGSRLGPGDHSIGESSSHILTREARKSRRDKIIVSEKLDGSCVGILKKDGKLVALQRSGRLAQTSPYEHLQKFSEWVDEAAPEMLYTLRDGFRIVGEWMALAHGTLYERVEHPFYVFDVFDPDNARLPWDKTSTVAAFVGLPTVPVLHSGGALSVEDAMKLAGERGALEAVEGPEGVVYRCESHGKFNFMGKYVRADHVPGKYLPLPGNDVRELTWLIDI